MGELGITPNRLRDLLTDYYVENDPERLLSGLDVSGMVDWTMRNGIEALNRALIEQYNIPLDIQKDIGNASKISQRVSALILKIPESIEKTEQDLYEKIIVFYKKHDPSKLDKIEKLVNFGLYHGVEALNEKLREKYGEELPKGKVSTEELESGPPIPPPKVSNEDIMPPPPPRMSRKNPKDVDKDLSNDITLFYAKNDPAKLEGINKMIELGMTIGRKEMNKRLLQLYGEDLNDIGQKDKTQSEEISNRKETKEQFSIPYAAPLPERTADRREEQSTKTKSPVKFKVGPPSQQTVSKASKNKKVDIPIARNPLGGACSNYRLDMLGDSFGVCVCGFPKDEHKFVQRSFGGRVQRQNSRNQSNQDSNVQSNIFVQNDKSAHIGKLNPRERYKPNVKNKKANKFSGPSPNIIRSNSRQGSHNNLMRNNSRQGSKNNLRQASNSNLHNFNQAHAKFSGSTNAGSAYSPGSGFRAAKGPCNNYRLDMLGKHYGDCECGYSRAVHKQR